MECCSWQEGLAPINILQSVCAESYEYKHITHVKQTHFAKKKKKLKKKSSFLLPLQPEEEEGREEKRNISIKIEESTCQCLLLIAIGQCRYWNTAVVRHNKLIILICDLAEFTHSTFKCQSTARSSSLSPSNIGANVEAYS